nr:MAG TPA: hypothetical protein [Caudoviricetes sp.]
MTLWIIIMSKIAYFDTLKSFRIFCAALSNVC